MEEIDNRIIDIYFDSNLGVHVKVYKGCEYKPKPEYKIPQDKIKKTPYCDNEYNILFKQWCKAKKGRIKVIVTKSYLSDAWFRHRMYGVQPINKHTWETIIQPLMRCVEKHEHAQASQEKTSQ